MRKAMTEHMDEGGSVLPLHDALIIPANERNNLIEVLHKSCQKVTGESFRLK